MVKLVTVGKFMGGGGQGGGTNPAYFFVAWGDLGGATGRL